MNKFPYEYVIAFMLPMIVYWLAGGDFERSIELAITFAVSIFLMISIFAYKEDNRRY